MCNIIQGLCEQRGNRGHIIKEVLITKKYALRECLIEGRCLIKKIWILLFLHPLPYLN